MQAGLNLTCRNYPLPPPPPPLPQTLNLQNSLALPAKRKPTYTKAYGQIPMHPQQTTPAAAARGIGVRLGFGIRRLKQQSIPEPAGLMVLKRGHRACIRVYRDYMGYEERVIIIGLRKMEGKLVLYRVCFGAGSKGLRTF